MGKTRAEPRYPVGHYELLKVIGKGGTGVVWKAEAAGTSATAAVKVVNPACAADPLIFSEFRREVRAVARLRHPHIVRVYDHGIISEQAEQESGGALVQGSPWIAMELAVSSLAMSRASMDWQRTNKVLQDILAALAYAHARGIVHRDIKPGNVLCRTDGLWLLADFGIAHAIGTEEHLVDGGHIVGTPAYMAPEQAHYSPREVGPWTDLYALGCVAWCLACGEPPFHAADPNLLLMKHANRSLPKLHPIIMVPAGFETWVRRCLTKDPEHRYRRAADAARDLMALGSVHTAPPRASDQEIFEAPTIVLEPVTQSVDAETPRDWPGIDADPIPEPQGRPAVQRVPDSYGPDPLHHRWRDSVGLGLFEIIEFAAVAREPEREALWKALLRAQSEQCTQAVIIEGPSGVGKTFLMDWLAQSAHSLGCAEVFRARHGPVLSPGDGIGPMLARNLRCAGLPKEKVLSHLHRVLPVSSRGQRPDPYVIYELTTLEHSTGSGQLTTAGDRHEYARQLVLGGARGRLPIVLIDDAHWGLDALDFAHHMLGHPDQSHPCLILLTAMRGREVCDEEATRGLDALAGLPGVTRLPIGNLSPRASKQLVRDVVGLEASLATRICQRSAGNPAHALALVRELYRRDALKVGPTGLTADMEVMKHLPMDDSAVWAATLERLLAGWSAQAKISLELAAAMGITVTTAEWEAICEEAGILPATDLVEVLTERGILMPHEPDSEPGWRFSHGLVRESLVERARGAGRWVSHNSTCAQALCAPHVQASPERRGLHLIEAERLEPAIELLLEGADTHFERGQMGSVAALMATRSQALSRLGAEPDDVRWMEGWILWARALLVTGALDEMTELLDRAINCGRSGNHMEPLSEALALNAHVLRLSGHPDMALDIASEAREIAKAQGDARRIALAERAYARVCFDIGETAMAERLFRSAFQWDMDRGASREAASSCQGVAGVCRRRGEHAQAQEWTERARSLYSDIGYMWGVGACDNDLGEIARAQGRLEDARALYTRARDAHRAIGSWESNIDEINLGLVNLELGQPAVARQLLLGSLVRFEQIGNRSLAGAVHGMLVSCASVLKDWTSCQRHLQEAREALDATGQTWEDVARLTHEAGREALASGHHLLAVSALELSRQQWEGLGAVEQVKQVDEDLARIQKMRELH